MNKAQIQYDTNSGVKYRTYFDRPIPMGLERNNNIGLTIIEPETYP